MFNLIISQNIIYGSFQNIGIRSNVQSRELSALVKHANNKNKHVRGELYYSYSLIYEL